jgi:galactose mutarotase-like enzyme
MECVSLPGESGFPGKVHFKVFYKLDALNNDLNIEFLIHQRQLI